MAGSIGPVHDQFQRQNEQNVQLLDFLHGVADTLIHCYNAQFVDRSLDYKTTRECGGVGANRCKTQVAPGSFLVGPK